MLKHICNDPMSCPKCKRNAYLRNRYHTDPLYREQRKRTSLQQYANDETYRENTKVTSRRRHRATYVPVPPRPPRPRKPRRYGKNSNIRCTRRIYKEMAISLLAERDGWLCCICQQPLDWLTVTIEHVIPYSISQSHAPNNLALAHRLCNCLKSNHQGAAIALTPCTR
jgi:hypothetical protein